MNSLVGYGVSSDSDSDVEDVNNDASRSVADKKLGSEEAAPVNKTRNFLLECGSASSDSDEEESSASLPQRPASLCKPTISTSHLNPYKLPSPPLNACSDSSVFANPFRAQAEQKLSALQKHVPLTLQAKPSQIGGKRICVSYRKDGRCRFGIKCKFAHDSDLQNPVPSIDCHPAASEETSGQAQAEEGSQSQETKEGEPEGQQGKKRRVGLSNTLIPPKKAMKQYKMQRERERINM